MFFSKSDYPDLPFGSTEIKGYKMKYLQIRRLRLTYGLTQSQAILLANLIYGEGTA